LKKRFITELVLIIPNLDKEIKIKTNLSDFDIKEVLLMKYKNKK